MESISITAINSISSLGVTSDDVWKNYHNNTPFFKEKKGVLVSELPQSAKKEIDALKRSDAKYKALDASVLYAIYTARKVIEKASWENTSDFGINIGSSRGATQVFEKYHASFLKHGKASPLSSPTTTLGNISSWVAHDLQTSGPDISHSITCSTSLHAMLNGIAWIKAGLSDTFLVGGSEAPLTDFTIAQMQALKIYANTPQEFPCRALDLKKSKNTMILGEAAAMACLEKGNHKNSLAKIIGLGYATEILEHNASLSSNAICFQHSMKMALGHINPKNVDIVITHTPGTIKGDIAEVNAIKKVFKNNIPVLTNNKWKLGHTLATSGMLSVEMAILMLQHQEFIPVPYISQKPPENIKTIMINAVGFGGNAVSILLTK